MSEQHVHDRLLEYFYAELDQEHVVEVERHLAECESCRRRLEETRKLLGAYRSLPALQPPSGAAAVALAAARAGIRACPESAAPDAPPRSPDPGKVIVPGRRLIFHPAWAMAACLVLLLTVLAAMPSLRELAEREVAPSPPRQRRQSTPGDGRRLAREQARAVTQDELPSAASTPKSDDTEDDARKEVRGTNPGATRSPLNQLKTKQAAKAIEKSLDATPGRDFASRLKGGRKKLMLWGGGRKRYRSEKAVPAHLGAGFSSQPARQEKREKKAAAYQPRPGTPGGRDKSKDKMEPAEAKQRQARILVERESPGADKPRQDKIVADSVVEKPVRGGNLEKAALPPVPRPASPPAPERPAAGGKPGGRLCDQDRGTFAAEKPASPRQSQPWGPTKNRAAAKAGSVTRKHAGAAKAGKKEERTVNPTPRKPAASRPATARPQVSRSAPPPAAANPVDRLFARARAAMARREYARALALVARCHRRLAAVKPEQPAAGKKRVSLLRLQARCELALGRLSQAASTIVRLRGLDDAVAEPLTRELAAKRRTAGSHTPATTGSRRREAARRTFSTDSYDEE